ncbi:hypothetical protein DFA_11154 [Cavenderia fasciculata]|uniref:Paired amphipathic helix containing protein n=1 Tax=Cavenderia fasciculata TaxID=261658 RepID=F4QF34_CACFS|nr:uncharacterized protein DFA_11154 [Cavenderia fasciculata]EGG13393.1 hypothetical protein DFA_11154 [Cavenderia fasciculata]|eukprot:XP_004350097.1 hypothetical protein DFA_11154 [Cavenderia fasciculata]
MYTSHHNQEDDTFSLLNQLEQLTLESVSPTSSSTNQQQQSKGYQNAVLFYDQIIKDVPLLVPQFNIIMKEYRQHICDIPKTFQRVYDLFKDHKHLIKGFSQFLPREYKHVEEKKKEVKEGEEEDEKDAAVLYVAKVKQRFKSTPQIYQQFLVTLKIFNGNNQAEIASLINILFIGHNDLIQDFKHFLPRPK